MLAWVAWVAWWASLAVALGTAPVLLAANDGAVLALTWIAIAGGVLARLARRTPARLVNAGSSPSPGQADRADARPPTA